jgi:hypothetical protein
MLFSCSVIYRATLRAPLFGQIQGEVPRISLPRTRVNKGERISCWENTGRYEGSVPIMGTTTQSVGKREVEGE